MFAEQRKISITSKMENSNNTIIGIFSIIILIIVYPLLNAESILAQSLTSQRTLSFDSRYIIQASRQVTGQVVKVEETYLKTVGEVIRQAGLRRVGFESVGPSPEVLEAVSVSNDWVEGC